MNYILKFNLKNIKQLIWPIILLYMIKYFNICSTKVACLLYLAILGLLIINMKKIVIPRVWGFSFFVFFILYSTVVGLMLHSMRNIARDLYYVIPTITLVVLGYYFYIIYGNKLSIMKTIVFSGTLISTFTFIKMFQNLSKMSSFEGIREIFDFCDYEVLMSFAVLFCYMFIKRERLFGKGFQVYSCMVMLGHIILSLARSVWVEAAVACIVAVLMEMYRSRQKEIFIQFLKIFLGCLACMIVFFFVAPKSITEEFTEKFSKTTEELDAEQEFNSVEDAMGNWRAYEIQMAEKQWKRNGVLAEIFGEGMGKGIHLEYVPYTWSEIVQDDNDIPLLHNGYYTVLPKGGLVGVAALIWLMLANVVWAIKYIRVKDKMWQEFALLAAITAAFLIQTYIVRGPVSQEANITWCLLVGWINAENVYYRKRVQENAISCNDNL